MQEFTNQNYLIIESNVVTNIVFWNGDATTWTPPVGSIQLIQSITPALVWTAVFTDGKITDFVLEESIGAGDINNTWDGTTLTTDLPKPQIPKPVPA